MNCQAIYQHTHHHVLQPWANSRSGAPRNDAIARRSGQTQVTGAERGLTSVGCGNGVLHALAALFSHA